MKLPSYSIYKRHMGNGLQVLSEEQYNDNTMPYDYCLKCADWCEQGDDLCDNCATRESATK